MHNLYAPAVGYRMRKADPYCGVMEMSGFEPLTFCPCRCSRELYYASDKKTNTLPLSYIPTQ